MGVTRREALLTAVTSGLAATGVVHAGQKPSARSNVEPGCSGRPVAFIADLGTVLRLTPHDDLQIALAGGAYRDSDDRTPFYFRVQGHLYDGQIFYGLFGPVLSGPSRYEGLICNILVRTDATDWRKAIRSQVNFKVGPGVVTRNHREHYGHPDGTRLEGYPRISRFGLVEVVEAHPSERNPVSGAAADWAGGKRLPG
jgi:hypothetical protein